MLRVDPVDIMHLVVLGHPVVRSFNRAVADRYCEAVQETGQTAMLRDLYSMGFNPLLGAGEVPDGAVAAPLPDVAVELDLIRRASVIVLVYPLWFGMPPAIVKGYVDRVMGAGFRAAELKHGTPSKLLAGKRLLIFSSSASTRPWLEEKGQWVALRQAFDTYLANIFALEDHEHVHFDAIVEGLDERYLRENLLATEEQARTTCSALLHARHSRQTRSIRTVSA